MVRIQHLTLSLSPSLFPSFFYTETASLIFSFVFPLLKISIPRNLNSSICIHVPPLYSVNQSMLAPPPASCVPPLVLYRCLDGFTSASLVARKRERERKRATEAALHESLCFPLHCLIALLLLPRHSHLPFCALSVCSLSIPLLLLGHSIHSVLLLLCRFCSLRTPPCPHSQCLAQPVPALSLTLFLSYSLSLSLSLTLSLSLFASIFRSLSASLNKAEKKQKSHSNVSLHVLVKM